CAWYRIAVRRAGTLRAAGSADRQRPRLVARTRSLELLDRVRVLEREADVVQPLEQTPARVVVDLEGHRERVRRHGACDEVDGDVGARVILQHLPDELDVRLLDLRGEQAALARVPPEDVAEPAREDGA